MSDVAVAPSSSVAVLEVLDPGLLTTVQDTGRPDLAAEGVTRGGAADTWSLAVANVLLGNPPGAAALEVTLLGPTVRALEAVTIAIGGTIGARIVETGGAVPTGTSATLRPGWTLGFDPPGAGARGYLAVPGGIDVPLVLGSRSTALGSGFGGHEGRALRAGDLVRAAAPASPEGLVPHPSRWPGAAAPPPGPIRVLPGPHVHETRNGTGDLFEQLIGTGWTVAPASDRVGLRLDGTALGGGPIAELASHGVLAGAVQLPPDGRPIVLLVDHQPTGGYPVIAVAIRADLPRLGQLAPGSLLRFVAVTPAVARAAVRGQDAALRDGIAHLRDADRWDDLWRGARG